MQIIVYKLRITWITLIGKRGWQTWRGMGRWYNLSQGLQKNHKFACHNSTIGTCLLKRIARVCNGKLTSWYFYSFDHYFQFNLDEISSLLNEGELKVLGIKYKPRHDKNCSGSRISITVLWAGSELGVNVPVIFISKGKRVHPRLRYTNLITRYGFPEGSCLITKKIAYLDYDTWAKLVKVVAPGITKIKVSSVACVLPFLFSLYLTLHIFPSKLSAYDMWFTSVVVVTNTFCATHIHEFNWGPQFFCRGEDQVWEGGVWYNHFQ